MRPPIWSKDLSQTLTLALYPRYGEKPVGYWLWDESRGMNLAMGADRPETAFVEALHYYQKRLAEVEKSYADLRGQVDAFVGQFTQEEES